MCSDLLAYASGITPAPAPYIPFPWCGSPHLTNTVAAVWVRGHDNVSLRRRLRLLLGVRTGVDPARASQGDGDRLAGGGSRRSRRDRGDVHRSGAVDPA